MIVVYDLSVWRGDVRLSHDLEAASFDPDPTCTVVGWHGCEDDPRAGRVMREVVLAAWVELEGNGGG